MTSQRLRMAAMANESARCLGWDVRLRRERETNHRRSGFGTARRFVANLVGRNRQVRCLLRVVSAPTMAAVKISGPGR